MNSKVSCRIRPHYEPFLKRASELFEVCFWNLLRIFLRKCGPLTPWSDCGVHGFTKNLCGPTPQHVRSREKVHSSSSIQRLLSIRGWKLLERLDSPRTRPIQNHYSWQQSWYEDKLDRELLDILRFLESVADVDDVRPHIQKQYQMERKIFGHM
jgi:CTD small phosphatase-like protein 2